MFWNKLKSMVRVKNRNLSCIRHYRPCLERLEARLSPIIGSAGFAPAILPGTVVAGMNLDGVVNVHDGPYGALPYGTGALLNYDGLHILTVSHHLPKSNITFALPPTAPGRAALQPITINVPAEFRGHHT